jgi:hypothetical protein
MATEKAKTIYMVPPLPPQKNPETIHKLKTIKQL